MTSASSEINSISQVTRGSIDSNSISSNKREANFLQILTTHEKARQLTYLMSQLNIKNNTNLSNIVKFVKYNESNVNSLQEDYYGELITESYQNYRKLLSRVKERDYSVELNPLDILSIINPDNISSIDTKKNSIEELTQILDIFTHLSLPEQKNIISIVKFIYCYKVIYQLDQGGVFWRPITDVLRHYSHKNWEIYNELVNQVKILVNSGCI
ncbi:hypothetical protein [Calothrix sp. PCC 6303]|uniref:hypothetical protein n=1 Tax=Calothrix sp. PCC 6303 TaxID=1170562 RepID=UPI0002A0024C|nr:hypothetical protein [Calothrix sp. PCC 6303]AFZ03416.1 hypothetical protein Cal6303_4515 [Calothrix sp. PCC 6303]